MSGLHYPRPLCVALWSWKSLLSSLGVTNDSPHPTGLQRLSSRGHIYSVTIQSIASSKDLTCKQVPDSCLLWQSIKYGDRFFLPLRPTLHIAFGMPQFDSFLNLICFSTDSHWYWKTITTWNVVRMFWSEIWPKVRWHSWGETHPQNFRQHSGRSDPLLPTSLLILLTPLFPGKSERCSQWHKPITSLCHYILLSLFLVSV